MNLGWESIGWATCVCVGSPLVTILVFCAVFCLLVMLLFLLTCKRGRQADIHTGRERQTEKEGEAEELLRRVPVKDEKS